MGSPNAGSNPAVTLPWTAPCMGNVAHSMCHTASELRCAFAFESFWSTKLYLFASASLKNFLCAILATCACDLFGARGFTLSRRDTVIASVDLETYRLDVLR